MATKSIGKTTGGKDLWLDASAADRLLAAKAEMQQLGIPFQVNSGGRSFQEQAALFAALNGKQAVARPGHSLHEKGMSVDVQNYAQARPILEKYGFKWANHKNDPWHFDFIGSGPKGPAPTPSASSGGLPSIPVPPVQLVPLLDFNKPWREQLEIKVPQAKRPTDNVADSGSAPTPKAPQVKPSGRFGWVSDYIKNAEAENERLKNQPNLFNDSLNAFANQASFNIANLPVKSDWGNAIGSTLGGIANWGTGTALGAGLGGLVGGPIGAGIGGAIGAFAGGAAGEGSREARTQINASGQITNPMAVAGQAGVGGALNLIPAAKGGSLAIRALKDVGIQGGGNALGDVASQMIRQGSIDPSKLDLQEALGSGLVGAGFGIAPHAVSAFKNRRQGMAGIPTPTPQQSSPLPDSTLTPSLYPETNARTPQEPTNPGVLRREMQMRINQMLQAEQAPGNGLEMAVRSPEPSLTSFGMGRQINAPQPGLSQRLDAIAPRVIDPTVGAENMALRGVLGEGARLESGDNISIALKGQKQTPDILEASSAPLEGSVIKSYDAPPLPKRGIEYPGRPVEAPAILDANGLPVDVVALKRGEIVRFQGRESRYISQGEDSLKIRTLDDQKVLSVPKNQAPSVELAALPPSETTPYIAKAPQGQELFKTPGIPEADQSEIFRKAQEDISANGGQLASIAEAEAFLKDQGRDMTHFQNFVEAGRRGQTYSFDYTPLKEGRRTTEQRVSFPAAIEIRKVSQATELTNLRKQFRDAGGDNALENWLIQEVSKYGGTINADYLKTKAGADLAIGTRLRRLVDTLDTVSNGNALRHVYLHSSNFGKSSVEGDVKHRSYRLDTIIKSSLTGQEAIAPQGYTHTNDIQPAFQALDEAYQATKDPAVKRVINQLASGRMSKISNKRLLSMLKDAKELQTFCKLFKLE